MYHTLSVFCYTIVEVVIGLEQTEYEVGEGDGFVEVCAGILQPADPLLLDSSFQADFNISADSLTALGNAYIQM